MPTTNPVPSQDPSDLLFNAGKLDEVVNGTANSFTDRLGVARRTVAGMNADFDAQLADAESDLNVYRADAAASAAEALGYLQTIRATSYGAYASDPATDPLGNPPTEGDEYWNTTAKLLKRWNGTTWQASDINTANLAASSGSSLVGYMPAGTGAVPTAVEDQFRYYVNAWNFMSPEQRVDVQTASPSIDVTLALNNAAAYARLSGLGLRLPPVQGFYKTSDTVDFSEIKNIDAQNAEIRCALSGKPAAIIGSATDTSYRGMNAHLVVRNAADQSTVNGTYGIKCLNFINSRIVLGARGFLDGIHFDGATADRVWIDNEIHIVTLYNNGNPVHFNMAGNSYAVKGRFVGGSYFWGQSTTGAGRGCFKLTLNGSGLVTDILVQSPEISAVRNSFSIDDQAFFVYANVDTTWGINTIEFVDARIEGYGTWGSDNPYGVNIATNSSGRIGVAIQIGGSTASDNNYTTFKINQPSGGLNRIRLENNAIRPQGNRAYPQVVIPNKVIPYCVSSRCYVPGHIIFDNATGYGAQVDYFGSQFASNGVSRACGDGDIVSGITTDSYGLIYVKGTSQVSFIELLTAEQFVVICYDAAGDILSGSTPLYAVGEGGGPFTSGATSLYRFEGRWLWLHKNVHSFYIGAARWNNPGKLRDIAFKVLYGAVVEEKNDMAKSPFNMVGNATPNQAFLSAGTNIDNVAGGGWQNEFSLRTTAASGASSGATTITLANATGISAGFGIGIELDTEIATGLRRYHYTTVVSVAGSVVTIAAALPANVAAGRTVLINRWRVRDITPYYATATEIATASNSLNTSRKRSGLVVYDSTNFRLMVATSSAPTAPWYVADGSASVTPA